MLLIGGMIITIGSLANAFCGTYETFVGVRALTGIGGGIIMPNAVATLTLMVPPGKARDVTLAVFASSPPVGAMIGALLAGVTLEFIHWKWLFIILACVTATIFASLFIFLPKEHPVDKNGEIDYIGATLGLCSLALFNFAWNQAPSTGWDSVYIPASVAAAVVLFSVFLYYESKYASSPIMPLSVFAAPTFLALILVVLLIYMSVGIALWYMVAWQQLLRGWSVLQLAIGWIPYSIGASAAVGVAAWMIPRLDAQWILAVGVIAQLISCMCLATMPEHQTYWAQTFPAIVIGSVCPDFVYVAAQIIASNSVGERDQGVAGSLIGTLNLYGNSLGWGFAGTIETQMIANGRSEMQSFSAALYFAAALAIAALMLDVIAVRMPKDNREEGDRAD
ncbi:hypothetical protein LTR22_026195 [Elasticomyces elasticus]|nr:hypothetical protein LTR22_026195 [Elasticomyces elasticus]